MIFNTDLNSKRDSNYEITIKNLEKAKELLDQRYYNKQVSDSEYIKRSKDINAQIDYYKKLLNK